MPHTVTIQVFQYDELSDAAKARAREWWAEGERQTWEWNDYEDAITIFGMLGFETNRERIRYSGFGCQGDGANFTGDWKAERIDVAALKEYAPLDEKLHELADQLEAFRVEHPQAHAELAQDRSCRYPHEYSVDVDVGGFGKGDEEVPDTVAEEHGNTLTEIARFFMFWLYRVIED